MLGGTQAGKTAGRLLGGMKKHDAEAKSETRPSVADIMRSFRANDLGSARLTWVIRPVPLRQTPTGRLRARLQLHSTLSLPYIILDGQKLL